VLRLDVASSERPQARQAEAKMQKVVYFQLRQDKI
jgi:hypothetical protein